MSGTYSGRSATQEIKARLNIADIVRRYVTLQRQGNRWVAPCPFHQETKPSFSVNEEEGFFHCFGCQASGDIFDFYARINGLEFREALEQLAEEAGVKLETRGGRKDGEADNATRDRRAFLKMYELAAGYYSRNLAGDDGASCRAYIENRRLAPEIQESFGLGWSSRGWQGLADTLRRAGFAPDMAVKAGLLSSSDRGSPYDRFRGRLMFPIRNLAGHVIAFGGRIINPDEDAAKYINSADSPIYKKGDHLYGLFQARRSISAKKFAMLTEGYMDVLTLHQYGYTNACGVLGTALTPEQVKRLGGFCSTLELLFDGDGPGRKAALRGVEMAVAKGMRCRVVLMPEGEDIDSLLHGAGPEAFESLRETAPDGLDFCIRVLRAEAPREAVAWVKNFLRQVELPELLPGYVSKLARGLELDEASLRQGLPGVERTARFAAQAAPAASVRTLREAPLAGQEHLPDRGFEVELIRYLVRNPHQLPVLREHGAELLLDNAFFRELWAHISECAPEYEADDVFSRLTDKHRGFWVITRMHAPVPRDEAGTEAARKEQELAEICNRLDSIGAERQGRNCLAAIRQTSSGDDFDRELLQALTETVRRKHGQH
ncbi:MAG: DNA primase [Deltaproteobacteria bacterium]|nr:DNA primase [Deltaproteobacteria bacterium]